MYMYVCPVCLFKSTLGSYNNDRLHAPVYFTFAVLSMDVDVRILILAFCFAGVLQ